MPRVGIQTRVYHIRESRLERGILLRIARFQTQRLAHPLLRLSQQTVPIRHATVVEPGRLTTPSVQVFDQPPVAYAVRTSCVGVLVVNPHSIGVGKSHQSPLALASKHMPLLERLLGFQCLFPTPLSSMCLTSRRQPHLCHGRCTSDTPGPDPCSRDRSPCPPREVWCRN